MVRTFSISIVAVLLSLVVFQPASARTPRTMVQTRVMQGAFAGSIKMLGGFFSPDRPETTSLLAWAQAATERARQERLNNESTREHASIPVMDEEDALFSRDRD